MEEKLRPYQKQDLQRYLTCNSIGNFSEQRTGKTPPVCIALKERKIRRAIIICPASLQYSWAAELKRWADISAAIYKKEMPDEGVVIINYEKMRGTSGDQGVILQLHKWKPQAVILDEAHRIKNRKSLSFKNVRLLRNAPFKVALSGTPAPNKPWEVWGILNWLFPKDFKSYWNFLEEFFVMETIYAKGRTIQEPVRFKTGKDLELQQWLEEHCIQHKRKEVMKWLEEEIPVERVVLPCSPRQRHAIDTLMKTFEYRHIITQTVLDNLTRVRQLCSAPEILDIPIHSEKLKWLMQYLRDFPEESVLCFSNSKKFLEIISKELSHYKIPHGTICGGVSLKQRQEFVEAFQKKQINILLLQTQAGKEGLTLDQADTTIFLDTFPPAADYAQAKDRMVATREENCKSKTLIHLMMEDTYDARLYDLVAQNLSDSDIINDYKNYRKGEKV